MITLAFKHIGPRLWVPVFSPRSARRAVLVGFWAHVVLLTMGFIAFVYLSTLIDLRDRSNPEVWIWAEAFTYFLFFATAMSALLICVYRNGYYSAIAAFLLISIWVSLVVFNFFQIDFMQRNIKSMFLDFIIAMLQFYIAILAFQSVRGAAYLRSFLKAHRN